MASLSYMKLGSILILIHCFHAHCHAKAIEKSVLLNSDENSFVSSTTKCPGELSTVSTYINARNDTEQLKQDSLEGETVTMINETLEIVEMKNMKNELDDLEKESLTNLILNKIHDIETNNLDSDEGRKNRRKRFQEFDVKIPYLPKKVIKETIVFIA